MGSQEEMCCVCKGVFEGSNMKKKRWRLHGESAEKTKSVLNVVCIEVGLEGLMETSDRKTFLCHICDAEFTGIIRMREKLKYSSSAVSAKLQCLTLTVRKRQLPS